MSKASVLLVPSQRERHHLEVPPAPSTLQGFLGGFLFPRVEFAPCGHWFCALRPPGPPILSTVFSCHTIYLDRATIYH